MTLKTYLIGLSVSSGACWVALGLTVINTNPGQGQAALLSFYLSLFVALLGTLTLFGYFIRRYRRRNELKYSLIQPAFRQAFLLATAAVALLLLQGIRLLAWWDLLLLAVILVLIELYLRSQRSAAV